MLCNNMCFIFYNTDFRVFIFQHNQKYFAIKFFHKVAYFD